MSLAETQRSVMEMKIEPPEKIDGARVLYWAWSGNNPFFIMPYSDGTGGIPIHGLAICKYDSGSIYRFSCNQDWEVENDSNQNSVEGAMVATSGQFDITTAKWQKK